MRERGVGGHKRGSYCLFTPIGVVTGRRGENGFAGSPGLGEAVRDVKLQGRQAAVAGVAHCGLVGADPGRRIHQVIAR